MGTQLWKLPYPSSARAKDESSQEGGRLCLVACLFDEDRTDGFEFAFEGVEAYMVTYYNACPGELSSEAYDRVLDLGVTPWLSEIASRLSTYGTDVKTLRHLMIYFDDGPCYEFLCRGFKVRSLDGKPVVPPRPWMAGFGGESKD